MSKIAVNEITDEVGTGAPAFPNGMSVTGAALTDPEITGGVYLGGTGSANYLDDYEEGTWTPTVAASGGENVSYREQSGFYQKNGNCVTVLCDMEMLNVNSGSGFLRIDGLPFTASNIRANYSNSYLLIDNLASDSKTVSVQGRPGESRISVMKDAESTSDIDAMELPDITGFTRFRFQFTYNVS